MEEIYNAVIVLKELYPLVFYPVFIAVAASFGSFFACCYYRIPRKISLFNPKRSFCPHCKKELTFLDLIPILSYIFLRAKCRHCGAKIAPTYCVIELLTVVVLSVILLNIL